MIINFTKSYVYILVKCLWFPKIFLSYISWYTFEPNVIIVPKFALFYKLFQPILKMNYKETVLFHLFKFKLWRKNLCFLPAVCKSKQMFNIPAINKPPCYLAHLMQQLPLYPIVTARISKQELCACIGNL